MVEEPRDPGRLADEEHGPLTDEEMAFLRHVRFGELPARATADELVETREAEPPHEEPAEPAVRREWG